MRGRRPSLWGARYRAPRCDVARSDGPSVRRPKPPKSRAVLLQVGFTRGCVTAALRELLPHDFTLTGAVRRRGMFLWHFPSSCPDRTLSCTLPYEARTFLTPPREARPPSVLRAASIPPPRHPEPAVSPEPVEGVKKTPPEATRSRQCILPVVQWVVGGSRDVRGAQTTGIHFAVRSVLDSFSTPGSDLRSEFTLRQISNQGVHLCIETRCLIALTATHPLPLGAESKSSSQ